MRKFTALLVVTSTIFASFVFAQTTKNTERPDTPPKYYFVAYKVPIPPDQPAHAAQKEREDVYKSVTTDHKMEVIVLDVVTDVRGRTIFRAQTDHRKHLPDLYDGGLLVQVLRDKEDGKVGPVGEATMLPPDLTLNKRALEDMTKKCLDDALNLKAGVPNKPNAIIKKGHPTPQLLLRRVQSTRTGGNPGTGCANSA